VAQFERIIHDINIMGGKPCIKGTRITVGVILMHLGDGISIEKILREYPLLEEEDILEAIRYASWVIGTSQEMVISA